MWQLDWQTIGVWAALLAGVGTLVYYAMRVRCALETVRAVFQQSVTDRMIAQVRWFAENPGVARQVFAAAPRLPQARIPALMCAHAFLLHFENVIAQRRHLAKRDYEFYIESMRQVFRQAPVLHEWMTQVTPGIWGHELYKLARENPAADVPEQAQI